MKKLLLLGMSITSLYANDAETFFLNGMNEAQSGKLDKAADSFKSARKLSDSPRILLELALVEEQRGNTLVAEKLYKQILNNNPPEAVRKNIERRLQVVLMAKKRGVEKKLVRVSESVTQEIAIIKPKTWNAEASIGFFYDDNVNAGPSSDSILIFDLPFILSPDAQAQSDGGYQIKAFYQTSHQVSQEKSYEWSSYLNYSRTGYFESHRYDYDSLSLGTRWTWSKDNKRISLPLQYSVSYLGGDLYTQSLSVSPSLTQKFSEDWLSISSAYISKNFNDQVEGRDGESLVLNQSFRWTDKTGKYFIEPKIFGGKEFTKESTLGSEQYGIGVGFYAGDLYKGVNLYIEPSIRRTEYAGVDAIFGEARRGNQFTVDINLNKKLPIWDLDLALGYTYTHNSSNIDLYDYKRNQVTLMVRKEF